MRILFMGSRPMSVQALELLVQTTGASADRELAVVTTSDDSPPGSVVRWWPSGALRMAAEARGLTILDTAPAIAAYAPDLIISVFHNDILPRAVIDGARFGAVNLHFGYLPTIHYRPDKGSPRKATGDPWSRGTYRGSNVLSHCVLGQEEWHAITLHYMSTRIDLGPVIAHGWNPLTELTTAWDLQLAGERTGRALLAHWLPALVNDPQAVPTTAAGTGRYRYFNRAALAHLKELPAALPHDQVKLRARAMAFPGTEPPYFLEGQSGLARRHVTFSRVRGVEVHPATDKPFLTTLSHLG